jgi:hypothetical protein
MDPYDKRVVAGLGTYLFSEMLLDVADFFEIPPPDFCGKLEYKENGTEKRLIQTTIQGRQDEPDDGQPCSILTHTLTGIIQWR